jgi:hypothetical protein
VEILAAAQLMAGMGVASRPLLDDKNKSPAHEALFNSKSLEKTHE